MRSKKAMLAALVVSAGAVVGIGQVTNTFPIVESACSCPTPTFPPQNTVAPNITGNVQVGQGVLAATNGTWTHSPVSYSYNWQSSPTGAGSWSDLGDTDNLYTLVLGDVGNYVRIQVTATNTQGSASANSNVLGPITQAGGGGGGPSNTLANVWISSTGSDSGANCVRSSVAQAIPGAANSVCKTFDKAYRLANCGDNVLVSNGSYVDQVIPPGSTKVCSDTTGCREAVTFQDGTLSNQDYASCVTFQPASGATVTLGNRTVSASAGLAIEVPYVRVIGFSTPQETVPVQNVYHIKIGINTGRVSLACAAWDVHDVIAKSITAGETIITGSSYVTLENSTIGHTFVLVNGDGVSQISTCNVGGLTKTNDHISLLSDTFQDVHQAGAGAHLECIHWNGGDYGVIQNTLFKNCGQQALSVQNSSGTSGVNSINKLLIQQNIFDRACSNPDPSDVCGVVSGGQTAFICQVTGGILTNVDLKYNSYDLSSGTNTSFQNPTCGSNFGPFTFVGNILPICSSTTGAGASYSYNVTRSATCTGTGNTTNATEAGTYTSGSSPDFDWTEITGAPSIDFVPFATGALSTDFAGNTRPDSPSTNFDAGAYEDSAHS